MAFRSFQHNTARWASAGYAIIHRFEDLYQYVGIDHQDF